LVGAGQEAREPQVELVTRASEHCGDYRDAVSRTAAVRRLAHRISPLGNRDMSYVVSYVVMCSTKYYVIRNTANGHRVIMGCSLLAARYFIPPRSSLAIFAMRRL